MEREPTLKGVKACAEMMVKMLELGFHREDIPALEEIFWRVRDHNGELKKPNKEQEDKLSVATMLNQGESVGNTDPTPPSNSEEVERLKKENEFKEAQLKESDESYLMFRSKVHELETKLSIAKEALKKIANAHYHGEANIRQAASTALSQINK